jgi:hypothetical protein
MALKPRNPDEYDSRVKEAGKHYDYYMNLPIGELVHRFVVYQFNDAEANPELLAALRDREEEARTLMSSVVGLEKGGRL